MSGVRTHGVGAAACANADVVSAVSAAATKRVLVENLVIMHSPSNRSKKLAPAHFLNKSRTPLSRQYDYSIRRSRRLGLCDFPLPASRLSSGFGLESVFENTS